ncbi:MAG TPA: MFS transporter [Dehalococcoidales bacterium]|nr:MFS transporter [Dehalococcoidales bacterium]
MPERNSPRPHVYPGWWSVLFIGIISGLGHGFNTYGISVFFKPIAAELELNRAYTALAAGIGRLEGGITSPLVGWLSDKFGPRWITIIGIGIAGAGMVFMYFISQVWQYYVAWGVLIGLGLNIGLTVAVDKMINDWFIHRRGLAQGIKFALIGVFSIVVLQIVTPMVQVQGWRFTSLLWGIIMFASLPLTYALVKPRRPEYYGLLPDGAPVAREAEMDRARMIERGVSYASSFEETEFTFRQVRKTSVYWLLVIGFCVHYFIGGGFNTHVFPFLTDIGISEAVAGGMMGMMLFFTVPSRFFGGVIADRIRKDRIHLLLVAAFLLQVIGIGAYLLSRSAVSVYILLASHGLSSGSITPLILLILGRYFGRKAFGSVLGAMVAFGATVGTVSPVFYGWVYDTSGSYFSAFVAALGLSLLAVVTTLLVRPPAPPAEDVARPTW